MCVLGVVRKISPPPVPAKPGHPPPSRGRRKRRKTLKCPPAAASLRLPPPSRGEEKAESFLFISPLRGNSTTVSFLSSKVRERGCFPDSLDQELRGDAFLLKILRHILMKLEEKLTYYIMRRIKKAHPFRISRILLLLDLEHMAKKGRKLTDFSYRLFPYGFFIEDFPAFLESLPGIEKKVITDEAGRPVKGYFELVDEKEVELEPEIREILDPILERCVDLDDDQLNSLVVEREDYKKLLGASGEA